MPLDAMKQPLKTLMAAAFLSTAFTAVGQEESAEAAPLVSVEPADRLGEDWWRERWEQKLAATAEAGDAKLVFLGDSITQGWEGAGKEAWDEHFAGHNALNLGFSGDRTEHLIWRLRNGKLDSLKPEVAVVMIGTNNTGHNQRAADDTAAGVRTSVEEMRKLWPEAEILLLAIFPRGETTEDPLRKLNAEVNERIAKFAEETEKVHFLDISDSFLEDHGKLPKEIMPDLLHLSPKGYELWAAAILPKLKELGL